MIRINVGGRKVRNNHYATLQAVKAFIQRHKHAPLLSELSQQTGLSFSTLERHLSALEAEGYIKRIPHKYRNIVPTGLEPQAAEIAPAKARENFHPSCLFKSQTKVKALQRVKNSGGLPKLTKAQLEARIEMVARKAEAKEAAGRDADNGEDVIRFVRQRTLRHLTACKVG